MKNWMLAGVFGVFSLALSGTLAAPLSPKEATAIFTQCVEAVAAKKKTAEQCSAELKAKGFSDVSIVVNQK